MNPSLASKKRPLNQISIAAKETSNDLCGLCHEPLQRSAIIAEQHQEPCATNTPTVSSIASSYNTTQPHPEGVPRQVSLPDENQINGDTAHTEGNANNMSNSNGDGDNNGTINNEALNNSVHTIVTCANMCGDSKFCKAATREHESPHFHFSCLEKEIPQGSKLFWDLCQYLDHREEEKRKRRLRYLAKEHAKDVGNLNLNGKTLNLPDKIPLDRRVSRSSSNSPMNIGHFQHTPSSSGRSTPSFQSNSNARKVTKNPFLCSLCDIRGSATYLAEYFANFRALKTEFFQDGEAVDSIMPVGKFKACSHVDSARKETIADNENEGIMAKDNGFVKHLMSKQQDYDEGASYKTTEMTMDRIRDILQFIPRYQNGEENKETQAAASSIFNFANINAAHLIGQPIRLFCDVSNSYHTGRIIDSRKVDDIEINRLKKNTKLKYTEKKFDHVLMGAYSRQERGKGSNSNHNILLDRDIGRTQYLVRFRARTEGRKVTVQQWMYLEEHPIVVGIIIIWVNVHHEESQMVAQTEVVAATRNANNHDCKLGNLSGDVVAETPQERKRRLKRMKSKFRPAQIFLRSTLEMMHVDGISGGRMNDVNATVTTNAELGDTTDTSKSKEMVNAVAYLFNKNFQCMSVKIADNAIGTKNTAPTTVRCTDTSSAKLNPKSSSLENTNMDDGDKKLPENMSSKPGKSNSEANIDESLGEELSLLESSFEDLLVADFHSPPEGLVRYLKVLRAYDESLVYATTCACLEEEEQRRVLEGQD
jgi:hypothetical protein